MAVARATRANRPRPTTIRPVTAPPWKARAKARWNPSFAASATRTLARTDTFMPMIPAEALATAPRTNPAAVHSPREGRNAITAARGMPTNATVRYWRERKAWAPVRMAPAISRARGEVAGEASTLRNSQKPTPIASPAAIRAKRVMDIGVSRFARVFKAYRTGGTRPGPVQVWARSIAPVDGGRSEDLGPARPPPGGGTH